MLKLLIVADAGAEQKLRAKLQLNAEANINVVTPADLQNNIEQISKSDLVISESAKFLELVQLAQQKQEQRQYIKAVTHQGIRLVPLENIYYFQAEHKYVNAIHSKGSLLIEDSLNSLEQEFADQFIRIHRKTLVATQQIMALQKNEQDQFVIKLRDSEEQLLVSRRQIPLVRKILKCL